MESLKISVDLKRRTNEVLSLQQGYTYPVELSIFDNGIAYTCTGATAQVHFLKSTGKFSIKTTDITISGNKVSFKLDNTLINRGGVGQLQVVLTKDGDVFGSWAIHCNVFANVIQDESTEDSNIIDVLGDLTKNIAKADPLSKALEKQIPQATPLTNSLKTQIPQATELVNEMKSAIEEGGTVDRRELGEFKKGYTGKEYDNLEQRINGDIDHVQQQINDSSYLPYEGTSIKADNTYYGLTKDMVVKGRTLQNLYGGKTIFSKDIDGTITIQGSSSNGGNAFIPYSNLGLIKPNTIYTIIYNVITNTTDNIPQLYSNSLTILQKTINLPKILGLNKVIFKTKELFDSSLSSGLYLHLSGSNTTIDTTNEFSFNSIIILEGDHTNTPIEELPFVEGIQGTGDTTKNLFNVNLVQGTIGSGGQFVTDVSAVRTNESIKVEGGKTYTKSNSLGIKSGRIAFYNNSEFISAVTDTDTFTVPSDANEVMFSIYKGSTLSPNDILWVQLEEGTEATPYEPYYDGYKIEILSIGKNIFDKSTITDNSYINANGDVISYDGWFSSDFIRVHKGEKYYIYNEKRREPFAGAYSYYYDVNKNKIERLNLGDAELVGIKEFVSKYDGYIRISGVTRHIEKGKFYANPDKAQILLNEPLRQLPNGVADSINLETGVLTRRVGKVVLDETAKISSVIRVEDDNLVRANISIETNKVNGLLICDSVPYFNIHTLPGGSNTIKFECICSHNGNNQLNLVLKTQKVGEYTKEAFLNYFKNNPITVYYELTEPTTEQLTPCQLKSFEGTTHIVSNNTLQAHISVKIPSNVQMVVQNLRAENKALNVELKDTKEELINTDLDILEMNWETDFRVCELEYAIYGQVAKTTELENNIRAISKYDQAKTLIEANRYNKATMTRQLTVYFERGYITEKEYQELIELMN